MLDKQISIYEDEEGNYTVLPTTALLVNVDYNEFEKDQYNVAVFNGDIPKDFTTETKTIKKPVPKYDITKKPEDKYTLTEKEVAVKPVWFIINGAKVKKAFNNKEYDEKVKLYIKEGKQFFSGNLFVPDDGEKIFVKV